MKKKTLAPVVALLASLSVATSQATEYSFPTGMNVSIERDAAPSYKEGSNVVYKVVSYFSVLIPDGETNFVLKDEDGVVLPVVKDGDRYFVDANVPVGKVVYFGPNEESVADPIRTMIKGPIQIGHIHFTTNSARLRETSKEALRLIAQQMADSNLTSAYLVGMADREGGSDSNILLSERRAEAAGAYLQMKLSELGVLNAVIKTESMGEYVSDSKDGAANRFDRKVSVLIYPTV